MSPLLPTKQRAHAPRSPNGRPRSPISASPSRWTGTLACRRKAARSWGRRATWRRSKPRDTRRPARCRCLLAGGHALRAADGPAAFSGRDAARYVAADRARRAGAAAPAATGAAARPRDDLPDLPAQGAGQALCQCRGARGGPRPLPGRRTDPSPSGGPVRDRLALVLPATQAGGAGRGLAAGGRHRAVPGALAVAAGRTPPPRNRAPAPRGRHPRGGPR